MGLIFSVFKTKKPKQFEYKPLYFDERREILNKKIKEYKETENNNEINQSHLNSINKVVFREKFKNELYNKQRRGIGGSQKIRYLIIFTFLFIVLMILLDGVDLVVKFYLKFRK